MGVLLLSVEIGPKSTLNAYLRKEIMEEMPRPQGWQVALIRVVDGLEYWELWEVTEKDFKPREDLN